MAGRIFEWSGCGIQVGNVLAPVQNVKTKV